MMANKKIMINNNINTLYNICFSDDFLKYLYSRYSIDIINKSENEKYLDVSIEVHKFKYIPIDLLSLMNINILKLETITTKIIYDDDNKLILFNTNLLGPELIKNVLNNFNYKMMICFSKINNENTEISIKTEYNFDKNNTYNFIYNIIDNYIKDYITSYLEERFINKVNIFIKD